MSGPIFTGTVCLGCPEDAPRSPIQVDVCPACGTDGGTYDDWIEASRD